jgi:redox-sensitive bicupin YhaK (pirin superfamily)
VAPRPSLTGEAAREHGSRALALSAEGRWAPFVAIPRAPLSVRVIPGEVGTQGASTRLVIPTSAQPTWPPFERAGETVLLRAHSFGAHTHAQQEVLTYVSEGLATYQLESGAPDRLRPGSARLLTVSGPAAHRIAPARGGPIRWFSLVVGIPGGATDGGTRLQASEAPASPLVESNAIVRPLVGPTGPMRSAAGLECRELSFVAPGTTFLRVGHDRRGLIYAFAGRGSVDDSNVEGGEAALVEGAAGISLRGAEGFRAIAATAPAVGGPPPVHGD